MHTKLLFLSVVIALSLSETQGQSWAILEAKGEMVPRQDNGFMACKGRFFMMGGQGIQPVNMYDPSTEAWTNLAAPPVEMHHFQAVRYGNEIYILGAFTGQPPNERPLEHIYIYDTGKDQWHKGDPIPEDRQRGSCGVVAYRGQIYMIGGSRDRFGGLPTNWVDRYDLKTGKWKKLSDAPHSRFHFHAGICNGKIYAAGGRGITGSSTLVMDYQNLPYVDVFDIESGRWNTLPAEDNIPTERTGASTVVILDHLLVIGGECDEQEGACRTVEAYDTERGEWETWDNLSEGRQNTQAFMCVGTVFIASGETIEMLELK